MTPLENNETGSSIVSTDVAVKNITTTKHVCVLLVETTPHTIPFIQNELTTQINTTPLSSAFRDTNKYIINDTICDNNTIRAVLLSDVISLIPINTNTSEKDRFFSLSVNNKIDNSATTLKDDSNSTNTSQGPSKLITSSHIVTSLIKDYIIKEKRWDVLQSYVERIEESGLQMCGLRLIYVPLNHAQNMKQFVNQNFQNFVKIDGSDIAVLCFAIHATNGTSNVRFIADKLRAIQGPEDCVLAVRTDPKSMRAICGEQSNNGRNIFYPLPFAPDKLHRETRFFFGVPDLTSKNVVEIVVPTTSNKASAWDINPVKSVENVTESGVSGSTESGDVKDCEKTLSLLTYCDTRTLLIGVSFELTAASDSTVKAYNSTEHLVVLQKKVLQLLTEYLVTQQNANNTGFHTISDVQLNSLFSIVKNEEEGTEATLQTVITTQNWMFLYSTYTSDHYKQYLDFILYKEIETLNNSTNNTNNSCVWSVKLATQFVDSVVNCESNLNSILSANTGSQLTYVEVLKQNDAISDHSTHLPMDFKSHVDVGLCDVCVVSIFDTQDSVSILWRLLALLPVTSSTVIVASKQIVDSDSTQLLVVLRGYQLLENVDFAIQGLNSVADKSTHKSNTLSSAIFVVNVTNSSVISTTSNTSTIIKRYKNKNALETICTHFHIDTLYAHAAQLDCIRYIPNANWHTTNTRTNTNTNSNTIQQTLWSLFPSGQLIGVATIFIPMFNNKINTTTNITNILSRVLVRLEKECYEILEIKVMSNVNQELIQHLVDAQL